jgi:hypothetical protein
MLNKLKSIAEIVVVCVFCLTPLWLYIYAAHENFSQ